LSYGRILLLFSGSGV